MTSVMLVWGLKCGFCCYWITKDDLNAPAYLCLESCSLFTQECITSLSIYQSRLHQGAFVFPSLHGWHAKSVQEEGWGMALSQDERFILHSLRSFVWVLSTVKMTRIKPQRVKHDAQKNDAQTHTLSPDYNSECFQEITSLERIWFFKKWP